MIAIPVEAQSFDPRVASPITAIGSLAEERLRLRQLTGDTSLSGFLLRSTSSVAPALHRDTAAARDWAWQLVLPEFRFVNNSDLPFSMNDGALWAGHGSNLMLRGGFRAEWGRARVFVLPELLYSDNRHYARPDPALVPRLPASRNPFSSPWHAGPQSIDLPIRFGMAPLRALNAGQTSAFIDAGPVSLGGATENEWWGPGIRNALILSNNASGFPHLFLRTARPLETRAGTFEGRWLSGWIRESEFFDFDGHLQTSSISSMAFTWQPPGSREVTLGAARSVFAHASGRLHALADVLNVFADVGQPNARPLRDSTMTPGRDQLLSLFYRWVLPNDGFETYGEWARSEFPVSLRDFLVQPNHTQAYTLGLQWLGEPFLRDIRLRAQGEASFLQQSTTFRTRPIGSWYTSRAVATGYTHRGQVLGAAIGPGSSSQFLALDLMAAKWQAGMYLNRIRWLEDARSQQDPYPQVTEGEHGNCEHDVSFLPGLRMAAITPIGSVQAEYSSGWRINVFFEHPSPCFRPLVGQRDVRNKSFSLTFTPLTF